MMTRRALLLAPFLLATPAEARTGFHATGRLTATDDERIQGYFQFGTEMMIAAKPKTEPYRLLTAMVGTEVQISVFNP